jgi:hypothetical protein
VHSWLEWLKLNPAYIDQGGVKLHSFVELCLIHATAAHGTFAMTATSGNSIIGTTTGWHEIREDMLFHNLKLPI